MIQLPPYAPTEDEQQPVYDYTIPLGERTYRVVLTYRSRQDRWYLDLYTVADVPLILGVFLAVDVLLLDDLQITGLPEGRLALWDTAGTEEECGWADLGNRCELVYIEESEIPTVPELFGITVEAVP